MYGGRFFIVKIAIYNEIIVAKSIFIFVGNVV